MQTSYRRVSLSNEALTMLERNRIHNEDLSTTLIRVFKEREAIPKKPVMKPKTQTTTKAIPEKDKDNDTGALEW